MTVAIAINNVKHGCSNLEKSFQMYSLTKRKSPMTEILNWIATEKWNAFNIKVNQEYGIEFTIHWAIITGENCDQCFTLLHD